MSQIPFFRHVQAIQHAVNLIRLTLLCLHCLSFCFLLYFPPLSFTLRERETEKCTQRVNKICYQLCRYVLETSFLFGMWRPLMLKTLSGLLFHVYPLSSKKCQQGGGDYLFSCHAVLIYNFLSLYLYFEKKQCQRNQWLRGHSIQGLIHTLDSGRSNLYLFFCR